MKTQKEILEKMKALVNYDSFGWIRNTLVTALNYENAKKHLKEHVTKEYWDSIYLKTDEDVIRKMRDYLDFAFDKAHNQRGLSACRSMDHYIAWLWLIGENSRFGDLSNYSHYGIPQLNNIKDFLEEREKNEREQQMAKPMSKVNGKRIIRKDEENKRIQPD